MLVNFLSCIQPPMKMTLPNFSVLGMKKQKRWGFYITEIVFTHFDTVNECDRQTDGQTDRQTDRIAVA